MRLPVLPLPEKALARTFPWVLVTAVALASFLSFSVQPLVGKLLLPVQGGAASTWLGTMLFFQFALLLGYSWAAWLLRRRPLVQVGAMATLALVALFGSRLIWVQTSHWTGIGGILLTLGLAILPATVLLFSTGPLMHGWLRGHGQPVPYYLYAFSNAGSLAAVLLYPFGIERSIGLTDQMYFWHGFLWVLGGLLGLAGFLFLRNAARATGGEAVVEHIPAQRIAAWLGASAATCIGMLGATHFLAAEIGSTPLAWVGPFGAYLLSFLVIFSGVWQPHLTLACLGWLAVSLTGFLLTKGVSNVAVEGGSAFWLLSLTAAGSFFGNGLLHEARPSHRFAFFYLVLAAGGVLGGLFASLGAPFVFLRPSEFLTISCLLVFVGLFRLLARRDGLTVGIAALIVAAPVLGVIWKQTADESAGALRIRRFRNIYGYSLLRSQEGALVLSSETTTHGTQIIRDSASRRRPTFYYTESSGVGRMIQGAQNTAPSIRMGVIGLGAGTLAAYGRPADQIDFWDIDPKAIQIARDFFTFLADSPAQIAIDQADGRKGLEQSEHDYDLLVVDAFCGDAIPAHLLTREALRTYFLRLEKRRGRLLIHASNRYSTVFPILAATAESLGWAAINVVTEISEQTEAQDWDPASTQYIILCLPDQIAAVMQQLPLEEDEGRVKRTVRLYEPQPPGTTIVWTDDCHGILDALNLRAYLQPR